MGIFWINSLKIFLRVIFIIAGAGIIIKSGRKVVNKIAQAVENKSIAQQERFKKAQTIGNILNNFISVSIGIIAVIIVMAQLGIDIGPILAGAGIIGVALGFGAQSLVKDLINGMFILIENHFNIGDVVEISGVSGLVESMSLRVVTLRDLEGRVHIIPNGEIKVVTNMTKEWSRCVLDIGVAYKENVDYVMQVLRDIANEMMRDEKFKDLILEPLDVLGVDKFGSSEITIKVMFKTQPLKQWLIAREFRRRIKNTFDEKGIEIPFPHLTVFMGHGESKW